MSGSVSPLPWTGNKGCIYTTIDAFMPPHRTYVEACMGSAEVFLRKKPVEKEIINDYNGDLVRLFRVLQRNENLERLIGRLFLSFNSEQIFRANKALLAEVPNILDDLTETSVIIENTQWNDFDLAVAFYENQVFSFSSTGKNFAITKKDMTKRFGRLIAACARLRNATIMHRDYKDCISYGAGEDAFILLDPPYKGTEDYYQKSSFGSDEHAKLFGFMNEVHEQFHGSCKFLITYLWANEFLGDPFWLSGVLWSIVIMGILTSIEQIMIGTLVRALWPRQLRTRSSRITAEKNLS